MPATREACQPPSSKSPGGLPELSAAATSPHRAYPSGEVSLGLEVLPVVLAAFEVPQVGLQGEGGEEEVSLLPQHALGVQHLLAEVPVVVVPCGPVTAERSREQRQSAAQPRNHRTAERLQLEGTFITV